MVWHVLTGDALIEKFGNTGIKGNTIISREGFIDGPLDGNEPAEFWQTRAKYIRAACGEKEDVYYRKVVREYEKLLQLPQGAEVNLWFEHDLFCQVNMWFCLQLLSQNHNSISVYRVMPHTHNESDLWQGFGRAQSHDLKESFNRRIKFSDDEIKLGALLWRAYQKGDVKKLVQLSFTPNNCFPYLNDVCWAEAERKLGLRPQKRLAEIINSGTVNFREIFIEFSKTEAIYGFGDAQVKTMLDNTGI